MIKSSLTPLTDEQSALVEQHLPLAKRLAGYASSKKPGMDKDKIFDAAVDGLISASRRWDSTKTKFTTFASYRIRGSIQDWIREELGYRRRDDRPTEISAEAALAAVGEDGGSIAELFIDYRERGPLDSLRDDENLREMIASMPSRYRRLCLLLQHGLVLRECAEIFGVSETWISKKLQDFQEYLQKNPPKGMYLMIERITGTLRGNREGASKGRQKLDLLSIANKFGMDPPCRRKEKGQIRKGGRGHRVLTDREAAVIKARRLRGEEYKEICKDYGVSNVCVQRVCTGKTKAYRHIEPADISESAAS